MVLYVIGLGVQTIHIAHNCVKVYSESGHALRTITVVWSASKYYLRVCRYEYKLQ